MVPRTRYPLGYIPPGRPQKNGNVERFNCSFREDILDCYLFESLDEVRDMAWDWQIEYNEERSHDSLNNLTRSSIGNGTRLNSPKFLVIDVQTSGMLTADAGTRLLESTRPLDALRAWLRLFVDYIGTKKIIVSALDAATSDNAALFEHSSTQIIDAANQLVARAIESGDVQKEVRALDLLYAVFGFSKTNDQIDWVPRAYRLIDILIAGLASERMEPK